METKVQEIWKDIPRFEGKYQVSNLGRFRSCNKVLKTLTSKRNGYSKFHGSFKGQVFTLRAHRVVAEVFIPNPENKPHVNHIDGSKTNNRVDNLEWCTPSENARHSVKIKIFAKQYGEYNPMSKLTEDSVLEIRRLASEGVATRDLANKFGVGMAQIQFIKNGKAWSHLIK